MIISFNVLPFTQSYKEKLFVFWSRSNVSPQAPPAVTLTYTNHKIINRLVGILPVISIPYMHRSLLVFVNIFR